MSTNKSQPSPTDDRVDDIVEEIAALMIELDEIGDAALGVAQRVGELSTVAFALYQRIKKEV
jgi:hypothetical protein